jgi:hypothetical protein
MWKYAVGGAFVVLAFLVAGTIDYQVKKAGEGERALARIAAHCKARGLDVTHVDGTKGPICSPVFQSPIRAGVQKHVSN